MNRWYNYSDDELIDVAMDDSDTLAYELARRLEDRNKDVAKLMGSGDENDDRVDDLESQVFALESQILRLEEKLSSRESLVSLAAELTRKANELLA